MVIDTSVWISGLLYGGQRAAPLLAIQDALAHHSLATCDPMDVELRRILIEKFQWSQYKASQTISGYFADAIRVTISGTLRACRDPDDDMILECGVAAGAQMIISGDKDLLVMGSYSGMHICTPAEYLRLRP